MPDRWERLWTPHRMAYLAGENRPKPDNDVPCPFCSIPSKSDEDALIVARGDEVYAVLNLYPYNAGHLLICTKRHVADDNSAQSFKLWWIQYRTKSRGAIWSRRRRSYSPACCSSLVWRCKLYANNRSDKGASKVVNSDTR